MNMKRTEERRTIRVVAGIILREDGKIFSGQRGYGHYKGIWECPGGKVEPGETDEEALARELREELGIQVAVGEQFEHKEHDYPEYHVSLYFYFCRILGGTLRLKEHMDGRWLDREHIWDVDWFEADHGTIARLEKFLAEAEEVPK